MAGGDHSQFAIGFDRRDLPTLHSIWDGVVASERWSEGPLTEEFEREWAAQNGLGSVAFGSWTGGALAALDFAGVAGQTVLCPSNTFMATPLAIQRSGANVEFVDCNRDRPVHELRRLRRAAPSATARARRSWSTSAAISPLTPVASPTTAASTGSS